MNKARTIFAALCLCLLASVALPVAAQTARLHQAQRQRPSATRNSERLDDQRCGTAEARQGAWREARRDSNSAHSITCGAVLPRAITNDGQGVVHPDGAANHSGGCPAGSSGQQAAGAEGLGGYLARGVADDVGGLGKERRERSGPRPVLPSNHWRSAALIIRYARTSTANPAETMRVTQYHVPLGAEKALITLSYIEGDPQAIAAHNRLKNSIVIR
jgi:hypothetical protein